MAYQEGTASDINDLLSRFRDFATANGWQEEAYREEGTGYRLHISRDGVYAHFRSVNNERFPATRYSTNYWPVTSGIGMIVGEGGYDDNAVWAEQPGTPTMAVGSSSNFSYAGVILGLDRDSTDIPYWFFADPSENQLVMVARRMDRVCNYLIVGTMMNKAGSWDGGAYYAGSRNIHSSTSYDPGINEPPGFPFERGSSSYMDSWNGPKSYVRMSVDGFVGWVQIASGSSYFTGKAGHDAWETSTDSRNMNTDIPSIAQLLIATSSTMTSGATLLPTMLWVVREGGGYSLMGTVPFIYRTSGGRNFGNGEEAVINGVKYAMFYNFAVRKFE